MTNEWSIQQIAKLAGTTSRTLRHYGDIGLLAPSRIGRNGYRYYDAAALVRLQRILLLRDLGLGLPQIAEILQRPGTAEHALHGHLAWLRDEQERLARRIASVESTITTLTKGETPMPDTMFDGFDHMQYRDEVEQRWGTKSYADSDRWWRSLSSEEKKSWQADVARLAADWGDAAERGIPADSDEARALAERHVAWLSATPGTPASTPGGDSDGYVRGLADMYVADPRFGENYGGPAGARFVRDALHAYLATRSSDR